jgi:hypothetical protein
MPRYFSDRNQIAAQETPIRVRHDALEDFRQFVPMLLESGGLQPRYINQYVSRFLLLPDQGNSSPSYIWEEIREKLNSAPWYRAYDLVERLYDDLLNYRIHLNDLSADEVETATNRFFIEHGYGWQMKDGEIVARLQSSEQAVIDTTSQRLEETGNVTAARELREAMADLSRMPEPDLTGAIQHSCAALECLARTIAGESTKTLGKLTDVFPAPLDSAVDKLWGFASQMGRHIAEGRKPTTAQAIAVVGIAATLCGALLEQQRT